MDILKKFFLSIQIILLITSCEVKKAGEFNPFSLPKEDSVSVIDLKDCDFESMLKSAGDFKYSELFSSVKYIKLESTESSTIGQIFKMEVLKNGDMIIFDRNNGNIVRFDSTGHFLNKIGQRGKSKNEYIHASDMAYDQFHNLIAISEPYRRALKFYNLEGEYDHELRFETTFSTFGFIDENTIAIFLNHGQKSELGETMYNILISDTKGNIIGKYDPFTNENSKFRTVESNTFKFQNGHLTGNEMYLPVIFTFIGAKIKPMYWLDFGPRQVPLDKYKSAKDLKQFRHSFKWDKIAFCDHFYETSNKVILDILYKGSRPILFIMNKKNHQDRILKRLGYNDLEGKIDLNNWSQFHNNKFYIAFEPSLIDGLMQNMSQNKDLWEEKRGKITDADKELLKDLSSNNNPILQVCTLKE